MEGLGGGDDDAAASPGSEEISREDLEALNRKLKREIEDLQERLAQSPGPVLKCGCLYKLNQWAHLLETWECRFFSLTSTTLSFWKSEGEAASHPRGIYPVENWIIHVEGMRSGRYQIFSIEDSSRRILLRLSEVQEADGHNWINALRSVGCKVVSSKEDKDAGMVEGVSDLTQVSDTTTADLDGTSGEDIDTISSNTGNPNQLRRRKTQSLSMSVSADSTSLLAGMAVKKVGGNMAEGQPTSHVDVSVKHTLRPSAPAHRRPRESPLSSDAIFHQSHAGLFNLCVVVLIAVNSRLIIENLMKANITSFPLSALLVEKLKVHTSVSEGFVAFLYIIITTTGILYPGYVIHRVQSAVLSGLILILIAVVGWMKLVSYAHTNSDIRVLIRAGEKPETPQDAPKVEYPDNITVQSMAYFMIAPTLCYQLSYPQTATVRKGWVLRQTGKLVVFVGLMGFITEQYITPTIKNSQHPLQGNYLYALERVLKLSIPTLYFWLCLFYCFFHLWLNILAEIVRFGDREFYKDWWNAKTVEEYWRMWNMPVHRWMVRHIYFPCIRAGIPKSMTVIIVFAISGIFHEVCIGVPCHMLRCWAFLGIMFQVGNMVFWFFFCIVGQPMCLLLLLSRRCESHVNSPSKAPFFWTFIGRCISFLYYGAEGNPFVSFL